MAKTCMVIKEPATCKKVRLAAEAMGFHVDASVRDYVKAATYYVGTTDEHGEGDVKTPEKPVQEHRLIAHRKDLRLAFDATFAPGFESVRVLDPVGKPTELFADYSYGPKEAKSLGMLPEHAAAITARRDEEYNVGAEYLVHEWHMKTAGEFYMWLDDWLNLFAPDYKKLTPVKKPKATEGQLLEGMDWNG